MTHLDVAAWKEDVVLGWDEERATREWGAPYRALTEARRRGEISDVEILIDPTVAGQVRGLRDEIVLKARACLEGCISLLHVRELVRGMPDMPHDDPFCEEVYLTLLSRDEHALNMGLEEALQNHLRHGNKGDPRLPIVMRSRIADGTLETVSTDAGVGFDLASVPDPTDPANLERPCGRGLLLMRAYMTTVEHSAGGRTVRMTKTLRRKEWSDLVREAAITARSLRADVAK